MSKSSDKTMKRTDTNRSNNKVTGNELQRTTSSYQGSVADATRYSDRGGERDRLTASQLHKSKTLEERIRQAERENRSRQERPARGLCVLDDARRCDEHEARQGSC
ncbi:hypothetical protein BCV70DRAFT_214539 [Testicularia cyperi]|uniref:Uncharacterized protein n=1 Tax=Testicularia cyperi TaxID=1882483 RepID=A0A317XZ50_9BASI|nr:hypothetical protein BCV70DRAFT_214539 [Testicularia cyperi]